MQLDRELGAFGPEWLVEGKCRQVVNHYLEKLSKDVRDDLKALMPPSSRKNDMVQFLTGDGEMLWNRFVADLSSTEGSRDYTPFSGQEAEALHSKIELAFEGEHGAYEETDHEGGPKKPKNSLPGSKARFAAAIGLLLAGFTIIFFTFIYLPGITRQFQEIRNADINNQVDENLQAVLVQLRDPSFSNLSSQVQQLETNFLEVEGALDSFRAFAGQISQAQELTRTTSAELSQRIESMRAATERVAVVVQQYQTPKSTVQTTEGTNESSESIEIGPGFELTLRELINQTNAMTSPETLLSEISAAASALDNYESETASLVIELARVWDRTARTTGPTRLNEFENAAINAIRDWDPEGKTLNPLENLREVVGRLADQSSILIVPNGFVESVTALNEQFNELKAGLADLNDQISNSSDVAVGLQGALQAQSENETLRQLSQRSSQLFSTVSVAARVISDGRQTYENTTQVLDDLESGAASLRGLAELQADLAFRGASPAVVLLLAIGGMFVTFGLTSLLKWVKDAEARRTEIAWQKQARMYTVLAGALLERGIDPTPLLGKLQSISISAEGERTIVKSPVSETVTEIAKTLQSTFRKG